jgi:uncharacterized phage protein gp47/JayE
MKSIEEIVTRLRDDFQKLAGAALRPGGDMDIRLTATAAQLYSLWYNQDFVEKQMFPQTAQGQYLDLHAGLRGIERQQADTAAGLIRFYIETPGDTPTTIPAEVRCVSNSGAEFITLASGEITAGETFCDIPARAKNSGGGGNIPEDSLAYMVNAPVGVNGCVNTAAFSGGADSEGDESLRARILKSYKLMPNGANKAYYETQVLNIPGVAAVSVIPRARGVGTVDIYIAGENGSPEEELLETVTELLNSQREICVSLLIMPPKVQPIDISASVKLAFGKSFAEVSAAVSSRIAEYFSGALLGSDVLRAKLGDIIFDTPGVENYQIGEPVQDMISLAGELPVLGDLNITLMG